MTHPAEVTYCVDLAQMQEYANAAALAGADMDATNRENGALYQPEIIVWFDRAPSFLRLHAMAAGTHFARRTDAYNVAAAIIAAAKCANAAPALDDLPAARAKADRLAYRATFAMAEIMCAAMASHWWRDTEDGRESVLGTLQVCGPHGPMWCNIVSCTWTSRLTPGCLLTDAEVNDVLASRRPDGTAYHRAYAKAGRAPAAIEQPAP